MRILSVTAQRPDSTGSGVYLSELVKGFHRLGHEQAVLAGVTASDRSPFPPEVIFRPVYYETEELPFHILGMSDQMPYPSTRYCDMTEEMSARFRAAFGAEILSAVRDFQPDVILCHHLYYLTALVRELCPESRVCAVSHGSDLRQLQKNPWQREYIRREIARLDAVFALHEEQRENILRLFPLPAERVSVVGTGYNSGIFHRANSSDPPEETEKTRLLFAGKIAEKKGVLSLLRALRLVEDPKRWVLTLAGGHGDAEEYGRILREARCSPVEVRLPGSLSQCELAEEMNRSDVFVLPSFYEGLPLVLIEALACGLRAICTDLPGIRPWLDSRVPDNGVIFVPPPEMANQDEPVPGSLPTFEHDLAAALLSARDASPVDPDAVQALSWDSLCRRLLALWDEGSA